MHAWDATTVSAALKLVVLPGWVYLLASTARAALHLHPKGSEDAFWRSEGTVLWLRRHDNTFTVLSLLGIIAHTHKFIARFVRSSVVGGVPWLAPHCDVAFAAFVMLTVPVNVLLWLALPPQRFSRHRDKIMAAAQLARLMASFISVQPAICGEPTYRQLLFRDDMARTTAANEGLPFTLARILFLYSGAFHQLFLVVTCTLPSRRGVWLRVLNTVHTALAGPGVVQLTSEDARSHAAINGLCGAAAGCLDAALLVSQPWRGTCSPLVLEWLISLTGVLLGQMLPILVGGIVEYRAKRAFVQQAEAMRLLRQDQQQGRAPQGASDRDENRCVAVPISIGTPAAWRRARLLLPALQVLLVALAITTERLLVLGLGPVVTPDDAAPA